MSDKVQVPTLRLLLTAAHAGAEWLEGVVVAPDRSAFAVDLATLHQILRNHGALLLYDRQWTYIPAGVLVRAVRGTRRVDFPWPLGSESGD
ncbi:MAG: hypothetical protein OWT27_01265 [Firmicutes bacterium]|nr:hypothetical protein [Bacillota bacterium]